jgi:hypothetical protein
MIMWCSGRGGYAQGEVVGLNPAGRLPREKCHDLLFFSGFFGSNFTECFFFCRRSTQRLAKLLPN